MQVVRFKAFRYIGIRGLLMIPILLFCHDGYTQDFIFKDPQFAFEYLRTIGYSSTGGADIKECIETASQITDGDYESWYKAWHATADRLEKTGGIFEKQGFEQSASEAYFRASNYYRTAEFFLHGHPDDPRISDTWDKSRSCFQKAIALSDQEIQYIRIPFEETTLPAYLCLAAPTDDPKPLLIIHSGFDGTAEELYFEVAHAALKRGYHCLLFEGPGQGEMIRKQKIPFRHNWETVVTPVVDYAFTLPGVDTARIALIGISFGGYLAPRALAFENRIKAGVANGGIFSFYDAVIKKCPPEIFQILSDPEATKEFNQQVMEGKNLNGSTRWFFANGMFTFMQASPSLFIQSLKPYTLQDCAGNINCTMLVVDSEGDHFLPGQPRLLYEALQCPKTLLHFTAGEGAEQHCQMGAIMISCEKILNWLDENL